MSNAADGVSKMKTGNLAIDFSNVEGFGELGKRNFSGEAEAKPWLKSVQESTGGENLETENINSSSKGAYYKGK